MFIIISNIQPSSTCSYLQKSRMKSSQQVTVHSQQSQQVSCPVYVSWPAVEISSLCQSSVKSPTTAVCMDLQQEHVPLASFLGVTLQLCRASLANLITDDHIPVMFLARKKTTPHGKDLSKWKYLWHDVPMRETHQNHLLTANFTRNSNAATLNPHLTA